MTSTRTRSSPGTSPPDALPFGVVVVNYNGAAYIRECLSSLAECTCPPSLTVVVDNASTDGSADLIAREFPQVHLLRNTENRGFTGGSNQGIRACLDSGCERVILLNPDTIVDPDAFLELHRAAARHPHGLIGPRLLLEDRQTPNTYGTAISWWRGRIAGAKQAPPGADGDERVAVLSGCCMLLSGQALVDIGLLDDGYFLYFEDADLAVRAAAAGYELWIAPSARVFHKESRSTGGPQSPLAAYYYTRNRHRFVRKFKRRHPVYLAFLIFSLVDVAARICATALTGRRLTAAAIAAGAWDGWKGVAGPGPR